jgi:hypothetical protein
VSASKKRWGAQICYGGKKHSLGTFDTKQEAALAYDREARQCGEEKHLNYESMEGAEDARNHNEHVGAIDQCRIEATACPTHNSPVVYYSSLVRQVIKEEEVERILDHSFQLPQSAQAATTATSVPAATAGSVATGQRAL